MTTELLEVESIEIRPATNGFVVTTRTEDAETEYVFDSHQKTVRFLKKLITPAA